MIELNVEERAELGKKTRALRRLGIIPVNVYGLGRASSAFKAPVRELLAAVKSVGRTSPLKLNVASSKQSELCLIREILVHPLSGAIMHVDFMRVDNERMIKLDVPIKLANTTTAPIAKRGAGVSITQVLPKVRVRATLADIPEAFIADCGTLGKLSDTIKVGDLKRADSVKMLTPKDVRVISVQMTRAARSEQD